MVFINTVSANWAFLRKTEASLARTDGVRMPVGCFAHRNAAKHPIHLTNLLCIEISM